MQGPFGRLFARFRQAGWRRTAIVNTILESAVGIVLAVVLGQSVSAAGSIDRYHAFFEGDCTKSGRINVALHLLINIFSTCIVASSNYFMQILSSPTRQEVDKAHQKSRPLEIGVPSFRNMGYISTRKRILWSLFMLSSVPIHVLFNSAVFETDYQGSGFFMVIATEDFVNGGDFHGPGASLIYPGAGITLQATDPSEWDDNRSTWGDLVNIEDFLNPSSAAVQNLSSISSSAKGWSRLDAHDCRAEYGTCTPRRDWGNVVLIASSQLQDPGSTASQTPDATGFVVDDLYDLAADAVPVNTQNSSTSEIRDYWDRFGPTGEPNSLWFAAWCHIKDSVGADDECDHSCINPLGLGRRLDPLVPDQDALDSTTSSWDIPLSYYRAVPDGVDLKEVYPHLGALPSREIWSDAFVDGRPTFNMANVGSDSSLQIKHCYAESLNNVCKVATSNIILLVVTICVALKVVLSILSCTVVPGQPLATLGDALASFIRYPDPTTEGKAAVSLSSGILKSRKKWDKGPQSNEWRMKEAPQVSAGITPGSWLRTYCLVVPGIVVTIFFFGTAYHNLPISQDTGAFIHNQSRGIISSEWLNASSFISKVILANTPQLILSFCYFAYNALFTRACTEMEWNSYAASYKPLRVSHPEQGQIETYRLQLPYRFSVPLIIISALLHWLMSNMLYVGVAEGDYLTNWTDSDYGAELPGLADKTFATLGFSTTAILIFMILSVIAALIPLVFNQRLKKIMVLCRNSSFSISAACHVSTREMHGWHAKADGSLEMQPLMDEPNTFVGQRVGENRSGPLPGSILSATTPEEYSDTEFDQGAKRARILRHISLSKVRWGVVQMPIGWYRRLGEGVEHLAFGTEPQDVKPPQVGNMYA